MIEQAAQGGLAGDVRRMGGQIGIWIIQGNAVVNALIGAVMIVVVFNGLQNIPEVSFTEEDELIKCYACRSDEALGIGITLRRGFDDAALRIRDASQQITNER